MARFYFTQNNIPCIVNGIFHDTTFSLCEDEHLFITTFYDDCTSSSLIDVKNNKVYGVKLIDWQNGNYDVILEKPELSIYSTPTPLCQKSVTYIENSVTVTIYFDGKTHALLECGSYFKTFSLPNDLKNYDILFSETGAGLLIVIVGNVEDKQYLFIAIFDDNFEMCVDVVADDINFSNNNFTTITNIHDMMGRTRYTTYSFLGKNIQKSTTFSYKYEKTDLIPYLFLESILANDENYKTYLSKEMTAPLSSFLEYFGTFDTIECPKYIDNKKISDLNKVAIYSKNDAGIIHPRFFTFEIQDNKITNILS